MSKLKDLTGKKFERLTALHMLYTKSGYAHWLCICDCGNEKTVASNYLINGNTKSCGCLAKELSSERAKKHLKDLIGEKFGKLTVIKYEGNSKWLCVCDCGKEKTTRADSLKNGRSTSCGCSRKGKKAVNIKDLLGKTFGRLTIVDRLQNCKYNRASWLCVCSCGNETIADCTVLISGEKQSCGCLQSEYAKKHIEKINQFQKGENHPQYNPDISDEERMKNRDYSEYNDWREHVYKRDNYTCKCCQNNKSGVLNAHHYFNYSEYEDFRTTIENGITLCSDCHKEFHKTYGYKNNNKLQIEEFINIKKKVKG